MGSKNITPLAMGRLGRATLALCLMVVLAGTLPHPAYSVSAGGRILKEVSVIDSTDKQVSVQIEFTTPMQYKWHFPKQGAREFLIALQPIEINLRDREAYGVREHLRAPLEETDLIEDITYDGSASEGPSLIVQLSREGAIEISQSKGIRSLVLIITPEKRTDCTDAQRAQSASGNPPGPAPSTRRD